MLESVASDFEKCLIINNDYDNQSSEAMADNDDSSTTEEHGSFNILNCRLRTLYKYFCLNFV